MYYRSHAEFYVISHFRYVFLHFEFNEFSIIAPVEILSNIKINKNMISI